jgi:hypothetical protein
VNARRAAWTLWAVATMLVLAGVVIYLLDVSVTTEDRDRLPLGGLPPVVAAVFGLATLGALVAVRLPGNPIGWLLTGQGVLLAAAFFASGYADYALLADPGALPGGQWAVWFLSWSFLLPLVSGPTLLFLLFPTGRAQSHGWRWVVWVAVAAAGVAVAGLAFQPGELDYEPPVANPLGAGAFEGVVSAAATAGQVVALLTLLAAALGMVARLRRARGVERVQLKWFAYAAAIVAIAFPMAAVGTTEGPLADVLWGFALLSFMGIPAAAGIAILRYRLYDIDLVIRRTLVYAALTATLAGGYLVCVLLAQLVIGAESDLAIAVSTLAMAALFGPARARIQGAVDRRFYRRRYDAAQTLEAFGARLRDELDIDALGADLNRVVRDTVQPAHVSLWLRERAS